ncbi:DUF397 domain-containing protein [Actinokineospora alba]|uniref:DUF397 domain-containing protein n=1 Tax=Actinokineospora alba TaxID=504798 RepID=UPI000B88BCDF|nr:DUF397 domain-containing protein [Actinokineospora alba]TDP65360.1 uncharacterized protein DUF397 [Actinokineospora alba]
MDLDHARWRTSTRSGGGECVEVAFVPGEAAVRDSKNPCGGTLLLPESAWRSLLSSPGR